MLQPCFIEVCAGVILIKKSHVLLIQRAQYPMKDAWSIPGGHQKIGESIHITAQRELYEETGLNAQIGSVLGVFDKIDNHAGRHFLLVNFIATCPVGQLKAQSDARDARWVLLDKLADYQLSNDLFDLIRQASSTTI